MRGVAPVGNGYYIIEGGGLPRIDMIGDRNEVDWNKLLARLSTVIDITTTINVDSHVIK
ncbi:hypothetical protein [Candidatus Parabeggiatoa sp. HSG14]|uniref:hypothetical protein n=1 Tax=Candidatus Parabeggiatoa sp. HSG14 TaxID=3055593 RepID=UPI0025A73A64|nr:hypothetical protein [Thiotrichales bacterium HSG14]